MKKVNWWELVRVILAAGAGLLGGMGSQTML